MCYCYVGLLPLKEHLVKDNNSKSEVNGKNDNRNGCLKRFGYNTPLAKSIFIQETVLFPLQVSFFLTEINAIYIKIVRKRKQ